MQARGPDIRACLAPSRSHRARNSLDVPSGRIPPPCHLGYAPFCDPKNGRSLGQLRPLGGHELTRTTRPLPPGLASDRSTHSPREPYENAVLELHRRVCTGRHPRAERVQRVSIRIEVAEGQGLRGAWGFSLTGAARSVARCRVASHLAVSRFPFPVSRQRLLSNTPCELVWGAANMWT